MNRHEGNVDFTFKVNPDGSLGDFLSASAHEDLTRGNPDFHFPNSFPELISLFRAKFDRVSLLGEHVPESCRGVYDSRGSVGTFDNSEGPLGILHYRFTPSGDQMHESYTRPPKSALFPDKQN